MLPMPNPMRTNWTEACIAPLLHTPVYEDCMPLASVLSQRLDTMLDTDQTAAIAQLSFLGHLPHLDQSSHGSFPTVLINHLSVHLYLGQAGVHRFDQINRAVRRE